MKRIKIKKGKHYPGLLPFSFPWPVWMRKDKTKTLTAEFMFTDTCLYDLQDEDQWDINKLFGFSIGHHHKHGSFRFGWRPILEGNLIEILGYEYHNGVRQKPIPICKLPLNQWNKFKISYSNDRCRTIYEVNNITVVNPVFLERDRGLGYRLGVYFGGNETSPHDIIIFKRKLK